MCCCRGTDTQSYLHGVDVLGVGGKWVKLGLGYRDIQTFVDDDKIIRGKYGFSSFHTVSFNDGRYLGKMTLRESCAANYVHR